MSQYAIVTDLNRCIGCLACGVACKAANGVAVGNFWNKVLRIGPNKVEGQQKWHGVEMYFMPISCQHCEDPECVKVCPTGASHKTENGAVQIDKEKCIGCQFCAMSCPYGVRYLNDEEKVVEKCTLCEQKTAQGELPACVEQCVGRARWFGDVEKGLDSFEGPAHWKIVSDPSYEGLKKTHTKMKDYIKPWTDDEVYHLSDVGNHPAFAYILRNKTWQGGK